MKLFIYEASARKDDPCYNTVEQRSKKLYTNVLLTKEVRENLRKNFHRKANLGVACDMEVQTETKRENKCMKKRYFEQLANSHMKIRRLQSP